MVQLTALSMFSGMGGDSLGLQNSGVDVAIYNEKEKFIQKTHELNFLHCPLLGSNVGGDITKVTDDEILLYKNKIDIIFSGFPCQGFSNAGKKKENDPRNTLFREFVRATRLICPKIIIGENVKGLLSRKTSSGEKYIDVIIREFNNLGYNVDFKVCRASNYGVPQKRDRLIIIGIHSSVQHQYSLRFPEEITDTDISLRTIVSFNMHGAMKIPKESFDFSTIPKECILTDLRNTDVENNVHPYLKLKTESLNAEYKGKVHPSLLSFAKRDSPIHCEIIDIRKPSKTIICTYDHQPRLFVPLQNAHGYFLRCLLPDELKQIQGFPRDYQINGNRKQQIIQIGNAVPPPLIEHIVRGIVDASTLTEREKTLQEFHQAVHNNILTEEKKNTEQKKDEEITTHTINE